MANINSVITYNANLSPAQAQIKALTGQIAGLSAAFNTLDKAALSAQKSLAAGFAANVGQIGGFTAQTIKAGDAVTNFGKQLAANKLTMREYFREAITGYTRQQSMLRQLAAQQVRYQQSIAVSAGPGQSMMLTPKSIDAVASKTALASQRFSIFNELIDGGATKMLNWGKNTQWAGRQLMVGFTLPLALFTATLSKQFRELDKELTRFQKVYGSDLGGAITESTAAMREQVKQLAFDISQAYGIAAKDTAALAADIAATGKEGEALMASVEQTTRLAVLGEVDRQEAMKATLSLQSAFKMNTNELAESINFLNAVENQTSATLEDLATAIPKVGPVVRSLGGDVKDLATLLVAMREGGIPAAEAANALKSGLASLINPTKQASEVAKSFGVDLVGIVEANRGQLMPTIYAMQEALSGLDSFSRSRIIEQIFGKYQFARMTALFDNIGRMGSQTQSVVELASKSSAELAAVANQEMRILTESTAVKFQRTLEQLKNSLMPIGQVLTESLIPVLDIVGKGLQAFSTFFSSLPESVQSLAKWTVALTAVAGPVIMLVGLFGNLIANGLKFGMMIVRLGAKMTGLKTEKFQLLDEQVMAAKFGVDSLTTSFTTQETALNRLVGVMSAYERSLNRLTQANPALFIPGALPGPRGSVPVKRQAGSTRPEFVPGSGRGDKIPAMLEPGEFVVNRKAAQRYAPVLSAMNRGTLPGFQQGGSAGLRGGPSTVYSPYTMFAPGNVPGGFGMSKTFFESSALFEKSMRASAITAIAIEKKMRLTDNNMRSLSQLSAPVTQEITDALRATAKEMAETGRDATSISQVMEQARPKVQAILARMTDPTAAAAMQKFLYPTPAQALAMGNVRVPGVTLDPTTGALTRAPSMYSQRTGEAASFQARLPAAAQFMGVPTGGGYTRAHLDMLRLQGATMPLTGGVLGLSPEIRRFAEEELRKYTIKISQDVSTGARAGIQRGVNDSLRNNSPSKTAQAAFVDDGRDLATGAMQGLQQGFAQTSSRPLRGLGGLAQLQATMGPGQSSPYPRSTGPAATLGTSKKVAESSARGMGATNAMFAISMLASSVSMLGGASNEAASKLGLFTTALMTATMLMNTGLGKSSLTNFLGMGSLGNKLKSAGAARAAGTMGMGAPLGPLSMGVGRATGAGAAIKIPGGLAGAGAGLARAGGMLSMLGGPVGIAAGIGITGAITAFMMYKQAAEEARARAISAFADPVKTAEYFGVTVTKLSDQIKNAQIEVPGIQEIDTALREAVQADYGDLITKIKYGGAEAGAEELSVAFNRMIASGMDAESAKEAVKAISAEAGVVGGQAYSQALREGMLNENLTAEERLTANVEMLKPMEKDSEGIKAMQSTLDSYVESLDTTGFERWAAQNLNNPVGDFLSGTLSTLQNINPLMQGFRAAIGATMGETEGGRMFEMTFDKDAIQQNTDMMAAQADTIHQMSTNIEENLKVTGDQLVKMTEQAYAAFQTAPKAAVDAMAQLSEYATDLGTEGVGAIEEFITSISPIEGAILNSMVAGDEGLQKLVLQGITAGMTVSEIIETLQTQGRQGIELAINVKVKDQEAKIALDNLKKDTSEGIVQTVDIKIEASEKALKQLDDAIKRVTKSRDRGIKKLEKDFEIEQDGYDAAIEAHQNQIDLINEETDARRQVTEEKIDSLEKEKESINTAADTYIKSLQKRQKADSFYAQQRKTSLGALQKLASGDVFGFLQDRQQMSADAQQFSYEKQISDIEERRDLEVDAIDETINKERERQEKFEKNQKKRIDLLEDEIDKINDISEARQDSHDQEVKDFEKLKNKKIKELSREKEDEQTKLSDLKDIRESANSQEIISARDLADTLGPELAKPYIEKQKEIIKGMYLAELARLKEEGATDMSPADALLREMYALLVGKQSADQMSNDALKAWLATVPNSRRSGSSTDVPSGRERSQNRASGGKIVGPGGPKSDVIPAMLSNGEYVVQASSVSKYGTQLMDSINSGKFGSGGMIKKYAEGGFVAEGGAGTEQRSQSGRFLSGILSLVERQSKVKKPQSPGGTTTTYNGGTISGNSNVPPSLSRVMSLAQQYSHLPYSSSPIVPLDENGQPTGWGCATSVAWLYRNGAGITLPHPSMSYYQYAGLRNTVSRNEMMPGDLIFYKNNGPSGVNKHLPVNHVEMAVGNGRIFNGGVGIQSGFSNHPIVAIKRPVENYAAGGFISGPGGPRSDMIPAMLSNGEYVVKASSVAKYGKGFMDQINAGQFGMGGLATTGPRMASPARYAGGGFVGSMSAATPTFGMPQFNAVSPTDISANITNAFGGSNSSSTSNSSNVKVVINGAGGKSAKAIANRVISIINEANGRRNHSRSI